jgi:hypothetical protein
MGEDGVQGRPEGRRPWPPFGHRLARDFDWGTILTVRGSSSSSWDRPRGTICRRCTLSEGPFGDCLRLERGSAGLLLL